MPLIQRSEDKQDLTFAMKVLIIMAAIFIGLSFAGVVYFLYNKKSGAAKKEEVSDFWAPQQQRREAGADLEAGVPAPQPVRFSKYRWKGMIFESGPLIFLKKTFCSV